MTAGGLVPVAPMRSASSAQYDPPPPGAARPAYNDELASKPRHTPQYPAFDGSHAVIPDGPSLDDPGMELWPMYTPTLSGIDPVSDFWDRADCDCG